jgi:hypothetical protein
MSTDDIQIPEPPADLRGSGRQLWQRIMDDFDLAEHERAVLVQACRTRDYCDELAEVIRRDGLLWADGRPAPAVVEFRQQSNMLARLVASLRVPIDEAEDDGRPALRPARGVYAPTPMRSVDGGR